MKVTWRRSDTTCSASPTNSAPPAARAHLPVQRRATGKWPPQRRASRRERREQVAVPVLDARPVAAPTRGPRRAAGSARAERVAPLDHRCIEVRMRDHDTIDAAAIAQGLHCSSVTRLRHSHRMLPASVVSSSTRCGIAKSGDMPKRAARRPRSIRSGSARPALRASSSVWPLQPTYWRSSSQTRHVAAARAIARIACRRFRK